MVDIWLSLGQGEQVADRVGNASTLKVDAVLLAFGKQDSARPFLDRNIYFIAAFTIFKIGVYQLVHQREISLKRFIVATIYSLVFLSERNILFLKQS